MQTSPGAFTQTTALPEETRIYYSRNKAIFRFVLLFLCLGFGIYFLLVPHAWPTGIVICLVVIVGCVINSRIYNDRDARIIISRRGLETSRAPFYTWAAISNVAVIRRFTGKTVIWYLVYDHPGGTAKLRLNSLDVSSDQLTTLLEAYQANN